MGAGVAFAVKAGACKATAAVPPLESKTRVISGTIRVIGCIERERTAPPKRRKKAAALSRQFTAEKK